MERPQIDATSAGVTPEAIQHVVGHRIKAARTSRGMTLAQVGGADLSRSFLCLVENGRSRISLRALAIVAHRLGLPVSYFVDEHQFDPHDAARRAAGVDHVEAALAYSRLLSAEGETERALAYAMWAAEARREPKSHEP
jgi:transcriptional regulator with XRE-family HTH domain